MAVLQVLQLLTSAREGAAVTIFEKEEKAGGVIRYVIPGFRIGDAAIDKDISFIQKMGVEIRTNTEITSVADLKAQGYDAVILAIGACKPWHFETGKR